VDLDMHPEAEAAGEFDEPHGHRGGRGGRGVVIQQLDVDEMHAQGALILQALLRDLETAAVKAAHEPQAPGIGPGLDLWCDVGGDAVETGVADGIEFAVQGPFTARRGVADHGPSVGTKNQARGG
jgi:hypothetical protein